MSKYLDDLGRTVLILLVVFVSVNIGSSLYGVEVLPINEPKPLEPRQALLQVFDRFPLVAISKAHGMKEEADFIASLIRDPEFAKKVNDIVLEAGNARYQEILDRYIAGYAVSIQKLRIVWREHTCSALGPRDSSNVEQLLSTVRAVNQKLPSTRRLRVLAGDPPIDWSKVHTAEELSPWLAQRETHYADVVEKYVLAKKRKALLIIGGVHLERGPLPNNDPLKGVMLQILEAKYPGKTFIVFPHEGFGEAHKEMGKRMASWPRPSLIFLEGTWLGAVSTGDLQVLDVMVDDNGNRVFSGPSQKNLSDKADAYLYLGPGESLTMEPRDPALYLDDAYFNEMNCRHKLAFGRELDRDELMKPRPKKWADNFRGDVLFNSPLTEDHIKPLK